MVISVASDHAGFALKEAVAKHLIDNGYEVLNLGTHSEESCHYPYIAKDLAMSIKDGKAQLGILVCGTGVGMSIVANKFKGIRACVCSDTFSAQLTRNHNDANVLCFGQRVVGQGLALKIVDAFVGSEYEGDRHKLRVDMISEIENENFK